MKILILHIALLVLILAQGCGFHLRGHAPETRLERLSGVYVSAIAASQIADEVKSQLTIANVSIKTSMEGADYSLTLSNEKFDRRVLSVSAETGKVEEYQITFTSLISISSAGGEQLVNNEIIRVSKDYTFDEEAVLGKFAEEEIIREELVGQAAVQIMRRLNAVTK